MNKSTFFSLLSFAFLSGWHQASAVEAHNHPPGMLGVSLHEVMGEEVVNLNLPGEYGAWVEGVGAGSPAAEAGIQVNDVIVAYNANRVESARALRRMVQETPAGRSVELRVIRQGRPMLISVTLGEGKDTLVQAARPRRSFGAWIVKVGPQLGEYFGLDDGVGLVVNEVQANSAADRAGIRPRDILAEIGGSPVTSPEMVGEAINEIPGNEVDVVVIRPTGDRETVTVRF